MTVEDKIKDFKKTYKETGILYDNGEYRKANAPSLEAVNVAVKLLVMALRKKGWTNRQIGYKNPEARDKAYKVALNCAQEILKMSEDVEERNSAIKLLILLPEIDIEPLCNMGIRELDGSNLDYQERDNLKAELSNSLGLEIRKTDPARAFVIFTESFKTVEKGTIIAGHLMHNAGTCLLILKNEATHIEKYSHARSAIRYLERALENYPKDQKGHRDAVEKKITNTQKEIENNFQ